MLVRMRLSRSVKLCVLTHKRFSNFRVRVSRSARAQKAQRRKRGPQPAPVIAASAPGDEVVVQPPDTLEGGQPVEVVPTTA